jgi:hypothetical protein
MLRVWRTAADYSARPVFEPRLLGWLLCFTL